MDNNTSIAGNATPTYIYLTKNFELFLNSERKGAESGSIIRMSDVHKPLHLYDRLVAIECISGSTTVELSACMFGETGDLKREKGDVSLVGGGGYKCGYLVILILLISSDLFYSG